MSDTIEPYGNFLTSSVVQGFKCQSSFFLELTNFSIFCCDSNLLLSKIPKISWRKDPLSIKPSDNGSSIVHLPCLTFTFPLRGSGHDQPNLERHVRYLQLYFSIFILIAQSMQWFVIKERWSCLELKWCDKLHFFFFLYLFAIHQKVFRWKPYCVLHIILCHVNCQILVMSNISDIVNL